MTDSAPEVGCRHHSEYQRHRQQPLDLTGDGLADEGGGCGEQDDGQIAADGDPRRDPYDRGHQRDEDEGTALAQ
jgi:hypothetical protein